MSTTTRCKMFCEYKQILLDPYQKTKFTPYIVSNPFLRSKFKQLRVNYNCWNFPPLPIGGSKNTKISPNSEENFSYSTNIPQPLIRQKKTYNLVYFFPSLFVPLINLSFLIRPLFSAATKETVQAFQYMWPVFSGHIFLPYLNNLMQRLL